MIAIPPAIHAQFAQFLIGRALPPTSGDPTEPPAREVVLGLLDFLESSHHSRHLQSNECEHKPIVDEQHRGSGSFRSDAVSADVTIGIS